MVANWKRDRRCVHREQLIGSCPAYPQLEEDLRALRRDHIWRVVLGTRSTWGGQRTARVTASTSCLRAGDAQMKGAHAPPSGIGFGRSRAVTHCQRVNS